MHRRELLLRRTPPRSPFLGREEAEALARRVLSFSTAEDARVNVNSILQGNTRFAGNQVTTAGDVTNASVVVTSAFGKRVASATTNRLDDESLRQVVATSERLARLVPEDPEYLGELGPQTYPTAGGFSEATATLSPEERARAVMAVAGPAEARGLVSTGFLTFQAGSQTVASKRGLLAYAPGSRVSFTTTVRTPDGTGSGWAGVGHHDWAQVRPAELGERAIRKAELSRNPREVAPGEWTVILEPQAVGSLVSLLVGALGARSADEGRSAFSRQGGGTRTGERIFDPRVSIHSDPADPQVFSAPFSGEGLPNRRTAWIENGELKSLVYDRYWAGRSGRQPTGFPAGYYMAGGNASLDELIASTERGLLVTRFWYIRPVDPRTLLYTGLTRDGTFLIENGRVVSAVKNLRFNESPLFMLQNVQAMGRPTAVSPTESGDVAPAVMVPALKLRNFTFSSVSDAV